MILPELPEPIGELRSDEFDGHVFVPSGDEWPFGPLYTADQMRAYALQAVQALRREPMTEWQRLDAVSLNSSEFSGLYWLAMKCGEVAVGEYEWRQGWNPHGFNLIDGGRVGASEVTHTIPFVKPALPHGITQKEQV